jgi:hypothetical protein
MMASIFFMAPPFVLYPPQKLSATQAGFAQLARGKQRGCSSSHASLRRSEKMLGFHSIIDHCAENKRSVGKLAAFGLSNMIKNYASGEASKCMKF